MATIQPNWHWEAGEVSELKEHIELRYGNAGETSYEDWIPIARIAKPKNCAFTVEWLVKQDSPEYKNMMEDAYQQLNFYLVEKNEPDPWGYAIYHCTTGANMYASVHWSYFQSRIQGNRQSSKVIQLSVEEASKLSLESKKSGKFIQSG